MKLKSPWSLKKSEEKKLNKIAQSGLTKGKAKTIKIK